MAEKMTKVLIRLTDQDIAIVEEHEAHMGEGFNAALRQIIREWARTAPTYGKVMIIGGNGQPEK